MKTIQCYYDDPKHIVEWLVSYDFQLKHPHSHGKEVWERVRHQIFASVIIEVEENG